MRKAKKFRRALAGDFEKSPASSGNETDHSRTLEITSLVRSRYQVGDPCARFSLRWISPPLAIPKGCSRRKSRRHSLSLFDRYERWFDAQIELYL